MSPTVNPLVAGRLDHKDAWSGVWIAEDIELLHQGISAGNWIDTTLGGVGTTLDALAFISDPLGSLVQYGVAWLMEHVKPLSEALDWLAGDPAQIAAHAGTWRNVAQSLRSNSGQLSVAVQQDLIHWGGPAATAYRSWAADQHGAIDALARAADTMATITEASGLLVATARTLVRDAIATFVSILVARLPEWLAEEGLTFGLGTPIVIEQVSTLVADWVGRVGRFLTALIRSLRELVPVVRRLDVLIAELKKILTRLRRSPDAGDPEPGGVRPPSKFHGQSRDDLIKDRGANVGRPGSGSKVREVRSEQELKDYFDALSRDGYTDITPPGFPGKMVELPDGTIVNWRTKSKTTGSIPTVDVNPGNGANFKVHVNPAGW